MDTARMTTTSDDEDNRQRIPETGAVFTFGKSYFADNKPNQFWIRDDPVTNVACGDEHTLLLTKSGRVFSFGSNDWGQLGHGNTKACTKPQCIKALKGHVVWSIVCGKNHSVVILVENRRVMTFGRNSDGELGVGDREPHTSPVDVRDLHGCHIMAASAGAHHTMALTKNGRVYAWGDNSEGQMGTPGLSSKSTPVQLNFSIAVSQVSCGYYHTAFITDEGQLYTFGESEAGKLGYLVQGAQQVNKPRLVERIRGRVKKVSCGGRHTAVVTENGLLYVFGDGSDGQLGLGEQTTGCNEPEPIEKLSKYKMVHVACGENHMAAIGENSQLYVWGDNQFGKLGLEDVQKKHIAQPHRINKFVKFNVAQVACGGCHTMVLAYPNSEWEHRESQMSRQSQKRLQFQCSVDASRPMDTNAEKKRLHSPTGHYRSMTDVSDYANHYKLFSQRPETHGSGSNDSYEEHPLSKSYSSSQLISNRIHAEQLLDKNHRDQLSKRYLSDLPPLPPYSSVARNGGWTEDSVFKSRNGSLENERDTGGNRLRDDHQSGRRLLASYSGSDRQSALRDDSLLDSHSSLRSRSDWLIGSSQLKDDAIRRQMPIDGRSSPIRSNGHNGDGRRETYDVIDPITGDRRARSEQNIAALDRNNDETRTVPSSAKTRVSAMFGLGRLRAKVDKRETPSGRESRNSQLSSAGKKASRTCSIL